MKRNLKKKAASKGRKSDKRKVRGVQLHRQRRGTDVSSPKKVALYRGDILVKKAEYLKDYILLIKFSNGSQKQVDFSPFLDNTKVVFFHKYRDLSLFKKFKIEDGNVVWGKDWDLIFPIKQLYIGKIIV